MSTLLPEQDLAKQFIDEMTGWPVDKITDVCVNERGEFDVGVVYNLIVEKPRTMCVFKIEGLQ